MLIVPRQMGQLTGEVSRLAVRPVTVVAGNPRSNTSTFTYLVIPVCILTKQNV